MPGRLAGFLGVLFGAAALAAPPPMDVLASRTVTQLAREPGGEAAGQVTVTVQLLRVDGGLQARVALASTLKGPAVANGTLLLTGADRAELARSNPRQLALLTPGRAAQLVSPVIQGEASCIQAQVNVWSGSGAPGPDAVGRQGPELQPVYFSLQVCRP